MIVIKLISLFMLFCICIYIGQLISKKYRLRLEELKELKNVLNIMETKIVYTYEAMPEIFLHLEQITDGNVKSICNVVIENIDKKTVGQAWEEAIQKCDTNLNKEDKHVLKSLGKLLGKTDVDGQVSQIKLVLNFLESQIENATQERNKNEKMYKTLRSNFRSYISYNFNIRKNKKQKER